MTTKAKKKMNRLVNASASKFGSDRWYINVAKLRAAIEDLDDDVNITIYANDDKYSDGTYLAFATKNDS